MNKYFDNPYTKDSIKEKLLKLQQNNKNINDFFGDFFYLIIKNKIDK